MYTYIATAPAKATQENSLDISLLRMIFFFKEPVSGYDTSKF